MRLGVRRGVAAHHRARAAEQAIASVSGAVKRMALLVTTPQATPRSASDAMQRATPSNTWSAGSCSARSCGRTPRAGREAGCSGRDAEGHAQHAAGARADHGPALQYGKEAAMVLAHLVAAAPRSGALSISVPSRSNRTALRSRLAQTSCPAGGHQVVDAGVAGQPVAARERVVFHALRLHAGPGRACGTSRPARSGG